MKAPLLVLLLLPVSCILSSCQARSELADSVFFVVDPGCEQQTRDFLSKYAEDLWEITYYENQRGSGFFQSITMAVEIKRRGLLVELQPFVSGALLGCGFTSKSQVNLYDKKGLQDFNNLARFTKDFDDAFIRVENGKASIYTRESKP